MLDHCILICAMLPATLILQPVRLAALFRLPGYKPACLRA